MEEAQRTLLRRQTRETEISLLKLAKLGVPIERKTLESLMKTNEALGQKYKARLYASALECKYKDTYESMAQIALVSSDKIEN